MSERLNKAFEEIQGFVEVAHDVLKKDKAVPYGID